VKWAFAGSDATSGLLNCDTTNYVGPDTGTGDVAGDCRDVAGNAATGHIPIKYDDSPPNVTGATPERPADFGVWWNHPIRVAFSGTDATSGIEACSAVTYSGPDTTAGSVAGSCSDGAGNTTNAGTVVKYDATPPTVTSATPARPPDHDGWWNHPVNVVFAGTDAFSGLAGCDTINYSGPADPAADVAGNCRDLAGNSATRHLAIKYDSDPPTVTVLTPDVGDNEAVLHWIASPDAVLTEVTRSPGIGSSPVSTVYVGNGQSFADPSVRNEVTYTYSIRATDPAANQSSATVTLTPRPPVPPTPDAVPTPAAQAVATTVAVVQPPARGPAAVKPKPVEPPRLRWRRVKGADYYNIQIYRGRKKVLTLWPKSPQLQLRLKWRFQGRLMRLTAATYDWYAWPGFGPRSRHRYGRRIVHNKFTWDPTAVESSLYAR
jgi:hypothetical protein